MPRFLRAGLAACLMSPGLTQAAVTLNIQDLDPACGQPQHNCRSAFQQAFEAQRRAGGGTLNLPAGTFLVDFPEVANDVPTGPPLTSRSLLSVPPRVMIQGHLDPNGSSDTFIEWKITSIPVFVFSSASYAGMKDLNLRFIGTTPTRYPYGDVALLRALGFTPTFPHLNQMSGGNYEMSSFAFLFDSERCIFDNLTFDSAVHDNDHVLGFAINAKGTGVYVSGGGGGLTGLARGNQFTNIRLFDYVMGLLISGQEGVLIQNIEADRRGSRMTIAPGHVIYFTGTQLSEPGQESTTLSSKNATVKNVVEGPDTYSDIHSLGTLAIKYLDGGTFRHIISQHPIGLIQTLYSVQNLLFEDMKWSSDRSACDDAKGGCEVPIIESAANKPPDHLIEHLTFRDVTLKSTTEPITVNLMGDDIHADGVTIETPPTFRKNQKAASAVLSLSRTSGASVDNYTYIPRVTIFDPKAQYNAPFTCWGQQCSDVHAHVKIIWPKSAPLPPSGHRITTPAFQYRRPDDGNSATCDIEKTP